jgi:hypothetical protein
MNQEDTTQHREDCKQEDIEQHSVNRYNKDPLKNPVEI